MRNRDDMKQVPVIVVLVTIVVAAAYLMLTTESFGRARETRQSSNVVTIDMTTRQWRFDVIWVSPPGSASFVVNPPGDQLADPMITVRKGDTIVLRIKDLDVPHGFAIEEFGINAFTPPGEIVEVKFVANQMGHFTFFCTVFCGTGHPNHKGTLIVQA